jgi:pSer/pThr/pTyr-binding forkhead associated (FHA) protein
MSAAPKLNAVTKVTLEILQGPHMGLRQSFEKIQWSVGRGPENDLILAQDIKVSRNHLQIQATNGQVLVKNINSRNVMLAEGKASVEVLLKSGSQIQVGDSLIKFEFENMISSPKPEMKVVPRPATQAPAENFSSFNTRIKTHSGVIPNRPTHVEPSLLASPKFRFGAMIVVVGLVILWIAQSEVAKKRGKGLRDSVAMNADMAKSETEVKQLIEDRRDQDSPQYRLAQAQFIKGFRDYQQGQFARAMEAFQSARAFYPAHELANKYWTLSKRKLEEKAQAHMQMGRRYLGTSQYRMCQSSFAAVMMLVKDDRNPAYIEARQFYNECQLKGGR